MSIQMIPLNLLFLAPENVRKTGGEADNAMLASLRKQGVLQNLIVRPELGTKGKSKGKPTGRFAVTAGGRRLDGQQKRAAAGEIPPDFPMPCKVSEGDGTAASTAENVVRRAMDPLDELDAFVAMVEAGADEEEVARNFGMTVLHVKQRLKLARVSPVIREAFRDGRINLDTLKAYTITDDFARQEEVFRVGGGAYYVRSALMQGAMTADDRFAVYVGLEAYEAAGGAVHRDLFGIAGTRIEDPILMRRLAAEKLQAVADDLRAGGWAWIEVVDEINYQTLQGHLRLTGDGPGLTDEEAGEMEVLEEEAQHLDPEDDAARLQEVGPRLNELAQLALAREWSDAQREIAGGWLSLRDDGEVFARLGYVKPEPVAEPEDQDDGEGGGDADELPAPRSTAAPASKPAEVQAPGLSFVLIEDLSAHFTAALQAEVAERPDVAYLILLHRLVLDTVCWTSRQVSLDIRAHRRDMGHKGATVKASPAAAALDARLEALKERLPDDSAALWQYLESASDHDRADILAVCVASCLEGVIGRNARYSERGYDEERFANARHLASVVGLDMTTWWRPTAANYLGAVSKDLVIEALTEAGQVKTGERLAGSKKAELVALAEERLGPTTWLPALLRTEQSAPAVETATENLAEIEDIDRRFAAE